MFEIHNNYSFFNNVAMGDLNEVKVKKFIKKNFVFLPFFSLIPG
jgi:hypothetical protein